MKSLAITTTTVGEFVNTINEVLKAAVGKKFGGGHGHISDAAKEFIAPILPDEFEAATWGISMSWQTTKMHFDRIFLLHTETKDDKRCTDHNRKGVILKLWITPFIRVDESFTLAQYIDLLKLYKVREQQSHNKQQIEDLEAKLKSAKDWENQLSEQSLDVFVSLGLADGTNADVIDRVEKLVYRAKLTEELRTMEGTVTRYEYNPGPNAKYIAEEKEKIASHTELLRMLDRDLFPATETENA